MPTSLSDPPSDDATLADLAHVIGHGCSHCRAIRRLGPRPPRNPLVRLIAAATTLEAGDAEADNRRHELRMRRRRARRAHDVRGVRGLLLAIRRAPLRDPLHAARSAHT